MTYQEMQKAAAEFEQAITAKPQRKQRGATQAQLEYRRHARALCVNCGEPFGMHSLQQTQDCANARS